MRKRLCVLSGLSVVFLCTIGSAAENVLQIGDDRARVLSVLGEPTAEVGFGDVVKMTYKTGDVKLVGGKVESFTAQASKGDPKTVKKMEGEAGITKSSEPEVARRTEEQTLLEGDDLVAWKLARQAAERKCSELSKPHQVRVPYQAATRGSVAAYAIEANATAAAQHPTYAVDAQPQRRFMTKSDTGDWTFVIPVKASYYNVKKKTRVPASERMLVKVTNYETEIRIEGVQLDSK